MKKFLQLNTTPVAGCKGCVGSAQHDTLIDFFIATAIDTLPVMCSLASCFSVDILVFSV